VPDAAARADLPSFAVIGVVVVGDRCPEKGPLTRIRAPQCTHSRHRNAAPPPTVPLAAGGDYGYDEAHNIGAS
jgi:hypothetical protein